MKTHTHKISLKRAVLTVLILLAAITILYYFLKPYLICLYYKDEMKVIAAQLDDDDSFLQAINGDPIRYYGFHYERTAPSENLISSSEVSGELASSIENMFENESITYIGCGIPTLDKYYSFGNVFIQFKNNNSKVKKFLFYAPDKDKAPEFKHYFGYYRCSYIADGWYLLSVNTKVLYDGS